MNRVLSLVFVMGLVLAGCSDDKPAGTGGPAQSVKVGNQTFAVMEGSADGPTATLVDTNPLKYELNKFTLSFNLEEGGSVTLLANGGVRLANAGEVKFSRDGGKLVEAKATFAGQTHDFLPALGEVDATQTVNVIVEVHQEGKSHVLVYLPGQEVGEENEAQFPQLTGKNWGVRRHRAQLLAVDVSEAHEE